MTRWEAQIRPLTFCFLGYCEEQGAVGGAGLEDDLNDLRLEEENEQPPLILETDWINGRLYPPIRGLLWCCYEHVTQGGQGQDRRQAGGCF